MEELGLKLLEILIKQGIPFLIGGGGAGLGIKKWIEKKIAPYTKEAEKGLDDAKKTIDDLNDGKISKEEAVKMTERFESAADYLGRFVNKTRDKDTGEKK